MTREDIIRMARERGLIEMDHDCIEGVPLANLPELIDLVAAAEREACAKVADEWQTAIHDPRYECDCATAIRARGQA